MQKGLSENLNPFLFSLYTLKLTFEGMKGKQKNISPCEIFFIATQGDLGINAVNPL
jgi:hypothetical protein